MANENIETKNLWQHFSDSWLDYPSNDPLEARRGYILSVITVVFTLLAVSAALISVFGGEGFLSLAASIYIPIVFVLFYVLTRQGYLQLVGWLIVLATGLFSTDPIGDITSLNEPGFLVLALVIVLSGLLITPRVMFITAVAVGLISSSSILLNDSSEWLKALFIGAAYLLIAMVTYFLQQQIQIALTEAKGYAEELKQARDNLAIEVSNRTYELQTSFNVTNQISNIIIPSRNRRDLFEHAAKLIFKTFNLSHVLIYTIDQTSAELTLQYGLDPAGLTIQPSHNFEIGFDIVDQAMTSKQPVVVNNLSTSTSNLLSSETGAEIAVPLKKGEDVLGVLYLHNQTTPFTETHKDLMQLVTNQLTIALDNFQLVAEVQAALADVEALNERLLQESWTQVLRQKQFTGYVYTPAETRPLFETDSLSLVDSFYDPRPILDDTSASTNEITIPIKLRGQTLGILNLSREKGATWNEDEWLIVQTIAEQIGLALDSSRLFENTQRSAWREQMVSESTAQVWSSADIAEVMKAAVAQLGDKLQASEVIIRLGTEDQLSD